MSTQEPEYLMSAAGIAAIAGIAASLIVGTVMYKWLFGGGEEGMGVKPAVSSAVVVDMEAGKEQAVYTAQPVYTTPVPYQDNPNIDPGQPINGYPNPQPNHVPFDIHVDNKEDVSTLGDYTAGQSKTALSAKLFETNLQNISEKEPSSSQEPQSKFPSQQGGALLDTVSQSKTCTSGQENTLASSYKIPGKSLASSASGNGGGGNMGLSLAQEDELICSSKASASVSAGKPDSMAGSTATMSQVSSSVHNSRASASNNSGVPSSASSYTTTPYSQVDIIAPPGKLGLKLVNRVDGHLGTMVNSVRDDSPLNNIVLNGDRIIGVDGEDVSLLSVEEITEILTRSMDKQRRLTVVSPVRSDV